MATIYPTQISECLSYDFETGLISIKLKYADNIHANRPAAQHFDKDGYIIINFKQKRYKSHRLAWYLYYGKWPDKIIDHINGIKDDNRISNLREVTGRQNNQNAKCHRNKIHLPGVRFRNNTNSINKWESRIWIEDKLKYLGIYETEIEAHQVYLNKCKEIESLGILSRKKNRKRVK